MRILYMTERFSPLIGGIETMSEHLLSALHKAGHNLHIVTSHSNAHLPDETQWQGIPLSRLHMLTALTRRDLKGILQSRNQLRQIKQQFQPDLVHIQFSGPSVMFHWQTEPQEKPPPTLITLHSVPQQVSQNRSLLIDTLQRATWLTAVSHHMLTWAQSQVPEVQQRASVIYNGIPADTTPITPLPIAPPHLLWIGRMVGWKRVHVLLDALAHVRQVCPNIHLLLAGDGPERAALEAQTQSLNLQDHVTFLGWVERENLPQIINQATLVVIPSTDFENLPMVALEVAQMGRPIVASNVSGLPEVVKDGQTGRLLENVTPQTLSDAICELLQNPDQLRRMGQNARTTIQQQFSTRQMVYNYMTLYQQMIDDHA